MDSDQALESLLCSMESLTCSTSDSFLSGTISREEVFGADLLSEGTFPANSISPLLATSGTDTKSIFQRSIGTWSGSDLSINGTLRLPRNSFSGAGSDLPCLRANALVSPLPKPSGTDLKSILWSSIGTCSGSDLSIGGTLRIPAKSLPGPVTNSISLRSSSITGVKKGTDWHAMFQKELMHGSDATSCNTKPAAEKPMTAGTDRNVKLICNLACCGSESNNSKPEESNSEEDESKSDFSVSSPSSALKKKEEREYVSTPTEDDVLFGRGTGTNLHKGNRVYRKLVEELRVRYKGYLHRQEKTKMSKFLINKIQKEHNGRFLCRDEDNGKWYIAPELHARKKVSQALRDNYSPQFYARKRAKYAAKKTEATKSKAAKKPKQKENCSRTHRHASADCDTGKLKPSDTESKEADTAVSPSLSTKKEKRDYISDPTENDVLMGSSSDRFNFHEGNKVFQQLVKENKMRYNSSPKQTKTKISQCLVEKIQTEHNGRFLCLDYEEEKWFIMPPATARRGVIKALREAGASGSKQLAKQQQDVTAACAKK